MSGALPAGWIKGMWVTSAGATYIESSADAHTGERSALVENVQANDARLEQNVKVKPQTYYRLSAWVKAEECGEGRKGANVSFADVYGTSPTSTTRRANGCCWNCTRARARGKRKSPSWRA